MRKYKQLCFILQANLTVTDYSMHLTNCYRLVKYLVYKKGKCYNLLSFEKRLCLESA